MSMRKIGFMAGEYGAAHGQEFWHTATAPGFRIDQNAVNDVVLDLVRLRLPCRRSAKAVGIVLTTYPPNGAIVKDVLFKEGGVAGLLQPDRS